MNKILKPLEQFYCDSCGDVIEQPDHGWIEWIHDGAAATDSDWTIKHHINSGRSCLQYLMPSGVKSCHLDQAMMFAPALVYSMNPVDRESFDLWARRMTIPHFEEARFYLSQAKQDGFFYSDYPRCYSKDNLLEIINRYKDQDQ